MLPLRILSTVEQVAAHLRTEIAHETLIGSLPGVSSLATELAVSSKTINAALRHLEEEGLLVGQGPRRRRLIVSSKDSGPRPMRICILHYEPLDQRSSYFVELQHALMNQGHAASYASKSLTELGMDVTRVKQLVKQTNADAWVVVAASREILEWFSKEPTPAFALFGRRTTVPIASTGPDTSTAIREATRRLIKLGHRRIVEICRSERRKPSPGLTERAFLEELSAHGIPTGAYNLPDWEETVTGFHELLHSLFNVTPPTAVIVEEAQFFVALQQFLCAQGLRVPEDVSIICGAADSNFDWCTPPVTHVRWDIASVIRRVVRWATTVSRGESDNRKSMQPSEFVVGGTIGPPHR